MVSTLEISGLSYSYEKDSILDNLNLTLGNNEILCLLGASGCGKTTLLKAIAGLLYNQRGSIELNGDDLTYLPAEKRKIGFIFQDYALFPHLTVAENIAFSLYELANLKKQQITKELAQLVGLEALLNRYPHQLSGGQQQRVAIARALAYKPNLLLLDEPFSNIDSQVRHQLISEIKAILKQKSVSAILVTHSKEEAFFFADKIAVMQAGEIIQIDSPENLYQRPNCRFVADFLGYGNYLPCQIKSANTITLELGEITFDAPLCLANNATFSANQTVYWLVRPQHINCYADENGNYHITDKYFAGPYYQYKVQLQHSTLVIYSLQNFQLSQKVSIHLPNQSHPVLFE